MAIEPENPVWTRVRPEHHAGAQRSYLKDDDDEGFPRGPNSSPRRCLDCDNDSVYDSASPLSVSWYVSSGQSSPENDGLEMLVKRESTLQSSAFDMKG